MTHRQCWFLLAGLGCVCLGLWFRHIYAGPWLWDGRPYQVDADCYSRLARVRNALVRRQIVQRFHLFENYPEGIRTHTTIPLDCAILGVYECLKPCESYLAKLPTRFTNERILKSGPRTVLLDWAGALVSPLIYLALALFLFIWFHRSGFSRSSNLWGLLLLATLPGMVWAMPMARPDHQSLVVFFLMLAWCAERSRRAPNAAGIWQWVCGVTWGLALWTSLFEPLVLFAIVIGIPAVACGFWATRKKCSAEDIAPPSCAWKLKAITTPFGISCGLTVLIFVLLERPSLDVLQTGHAAQIEQWLTTIGEIRGLTVREFLADFTPVICLLPWMAWRIFSNLSAENARPCLAVNKRYAVWTYGLFFLMLICTVFQRRWIYCAAAFQVFAMVIWWQVEPLRWLRMLVLAGYVAGTTWSLSVLGWHPVQKEAPLTVEASQLAESIRTPGAVLAPWWISPSLLYYSGQPIVSGSSHESITGTMDSARFFSTSSWIEAENILQHRRVRWVVVYQEDRLLENSRQILGRTGASPKDVSWSMATRLWNAKLVPTTLRLRSMTSHLRLYEYQPPFERF